VDAGGVRRVESGPSHSADHVVVTPN